MDFNDPTITETQKSELIFATSGEEVLYDLLFSNELKSNLKKSQTFNESLTYLQELNSFHIDRLQSEPRNLYEQKQNIHEEIKNLAFSNYKTFIRTAQCSKDIYSDFSVIETKLDSLIQKIPDFSQSSDNFSKNIQNINTLRRSNNLTLQKHNQLLEILEISQLMETCVRNEYYDEALELANYVKRLDKKYSSTIPLINQIVDDVNKSLNLMLSQLLAQLKTSIQFNQCLKIIGLIRRLDVFTESELRIKFLQLRDYWLDNLLSRIPSQDPYHHVTKTIEEMRIHLFDIITQYRAIFSDDDFLSSNILSGSQNITNLILNHKDLNESKLFYCWLNKKINFFLAILERDIKLGVGNRLDGVLSQSMYFGLAFSRVGLDFRALMIPIFERIVFEQFKKQVDLANLKFEEYLAKVNWSDLNLDKSRMQDIFESKLGSIINPPIQLLDFPPLAHYLNTILNCFNEIRLCLPLSLYSKVFNEMEESFRKMAKFVNVYFNKEMLDKKEKELFGQFMSNMVNLLIPFLEKCFLGMFPLDQIQKIYGISQIEMEKIKSKLKFDVDKLFNEVKYLIPEVKIELPIEVVLENKQDVSESDKKENQIEEVSEISNEANNQLGENQQDDSRPILTEF
ncbi:unnamed protein product [Brachionus calyciflorus]|uniref:Conserved oligomeric Golgi complex subunit 8 n=1 Tax=Brachionus calyciflorus TaxID=104777 RepID=A0A814J130_9BILA|nr:unnamed protein product [Brachionus calyciflorus]